jgi:hypothetical protein
MCSAIVQIWSPRRRSPELHPDGKFGKYAKVTAETISRITDRVVEEMQAWTSRPLERGRFLEIVANHRRAC